MSVLPYHNRRPGFLQGPGLDSAAQAPIILPMKPIHIIHQGKGWLAVDKPGGISVHNDPGYDMVSRLGKQLGTRLHPVHRLDRETSGILILATAPAALKQLSEIFRRGEITKEYLALVHGEFDTDTGLWDKPLTKAAAGRNNPAGKGKKLPSRTRFTVKTRTPHYTLLALTLETGRTHQIRRHAKLSGHPVTGDSRYASKRAIAFLREQRDFHAMGLHAHRLTLAQDPDGEPGSPLILTSPGLPSEIQRLMDEDQA